MTSILCLHQDSWGPVQFSEDDSRGCSQSESCSHGRDTQKGHFNARIFLKKIHFLFASLGADLSIKFDMMIFESF